MTETNDRRPKRFDPIAACYLAASPYIISQSGHHSLVTVFMYRPAPLSTYTARLPTVAVFNSSALRMHELLYTLQLHDLLIYCIVFCIYGHSVYICTVYSKAYTIRFLHIRPTLTVCICLLYI